MPALSEKEKPAPPLALGGVVADKYRIETLLGEGGMGFVFEATHLQLGHRVALKVLNSAVMADREMTERFLREGRALARLQGEHIARVSDVGTLFSGEPYLVMEFLEGRDLARELSARGPLPLAEAVELLAQSCEALAEAHVRGIVHRDLKPANLFLTHKLDGEASVKVLDFGISKFTQQDDAHIDSENITVTSSLVGTPKYMSPEQIQDSRTVDSRTDIWGLGTILYELLTQTRPFAAPSLALVCVKILHDEIPAPSTLRADLPPGIDEVVARCLKKNPDERFGSVGELALALVPFGSAAVASSAARVTRILAARGSGAKLGADASGSLSGVRTPSLPNADSSQPVTRTPSKVSIGNAENETLTASTLLESPAKNARRVRIVAVALGGLALGALLFFALHTTKPDTTTPVATASTGAPTALSTAEPTHTATIATPPVTASTAAPTASATATTKTQPRWTHNSTHAHATPTATQTTTTAPTGTENVLEDRH